MSLAPSLFASPALGSVRERSGSQQAPDSHRQSPFGGYASPPPGGAFGASFGEPRRRRAPEGATAFLAPVYGAAGLAEALCRACAVRGGVYALVDNNSGRCMGAALTVPPRATSFGRMG